MKTLDKMQGRTEQLPTYMVKWVYLVYKSKTDVMLTAKSEQKLYNLTYLQYHTDANYFVKCNVQHLRT